MGKVWHDAANTAHRAAAGEVRIVSLVPSITELLFELGLGDRIVGRTTFCVHPKTAVGRVPRVGGTKTLRMDRLAALEPTHVIVNIDENRREDVDAISRFAPSIVVTHPLTPLDNVALYGLIGGIFGRRDAAQALADALEHELELIARSAARLPARKVLYLIWRAPWMTVSEPTYISRMLALVNWFTLGGDPDTRYPAIDLAEASADADLVLLSSEPFPFKEKHLAEVRAAVPARTEVHFIDGEYVSWYGSRAIAGIEYLRTLAERLAAPR